MTEAADMLFPPEPGSSLGVSFPKIRKSADTENSPAACTSQAAGTAPRILAVEIDERVSPSALASWASVSVLEAWRSRLRIFSAAAWDSEVIPSTRPRVSTPRTVFINHPYYQRLILPVPNNGQSNPMFTNCDAICELVHYLCSILVNTR